MVHRSLRGGLMATTTFCGAIFSAVAVPALVVALASALPTVVQAQDLTSGSLVGTVKSETGTPAAGATVTITGVNNGYTSTVTTDSSGKFSLTQIPTGSYAIEIVAADGAKTSATVQVSLGAVSNYDFTTAADTGTTEVVIRGKARRNLDFDRTTTGQVVDVQATASRVPVGRNLQSIVNLVPGISLNNNFAISGLDPAFGAISGSSPAENIYYVNGMNITNFRNFLGGSTVPFDFYDQIEVKTGGYPAEFGRSTGGAIIATTRSGSNVFHGGVNVYYEPAGMATQSTLYPLDFTDPDPNNHTSKRGYLPVTSQDESVWLSGPILKDHIYFFAFYNDRKLKAAQQTTDGTGAVTRTSYDTAGDPFWGGKLDFVLNPSQRLEYTYFTDDQTVLTDVASSHPVTVFDGKGGLNRIVKYTGKFTDWFTLSALYGRSTFNQSTLSTDDLMAAVFLNGDIVRGNSNLLVAFGKDYRENKRVDADFYYNLLGRHHTRIGFDEEDLGSDNISEYSGGVYYRYYGAGTDCGGTGTVTDNCVRVRHLNNNGSFTTTQSAWYAEDVWDVTDRLNLQIGLRNEDFNNKNKAGESFIHTKNQLAARLGATYDVFGDKSTKVSAFYGRYYLPIAANTNIRASGGEYFQQDFYTWTSRDADTLVPVLGPLLLAQNLEDGAIPKASTLVSQNIEPQFQDEYILGISKRLDNGWNVGASLTYRDLKSVLEDTDLSYSTACQELGIPLDDPDTDDVDENECGTFGSSGYVLINPGKPVIVELGGDFGGDWAGKTVTISPEAVGLPKAERTYAALTLTADRPWDGTWSFGGSVVISRSYGNYEGGVKSDNGQSDTGLTQDFDQPGWMDYSKGLLPNHHALSFKAYGAYAINDHVRFGYNVSVLSPRHYGCIGNYPFEDGRADNTTSTAWYCGGHATPRGKSFKGDWIKNIDVSAVYDLPIPVGTLEMRADIFNLLDFQGVTLFNEFGEASGDVGNISPTYGKPLGYQQPRYVRLGLSYKY